MNILIKIKETFDCFFLDKYPHFDTKPIIAYLKEYKSEEEEVIGEQ